MGVFTRCLSVVSPRIDGVFGSDDIGAVPVRLVVGRALSAPHRFRT
jgi:hypothetical protein